MKSFFLVVSCLTAATFGATRRAEPSAQTPYESTVPRADLQINGRMGMEFIDVMATRMPIDALLRRIARECNRPLVGIDELSRIPEVTIGLIDTELRDALRWVGGSVGLHITLTTSEIRVAEDLPPYPTRSELYQRASNGYSRALADHADSLLAPSAAWNRARIEEAKPNRALEAAKAYDSITEKYPTSDLVPDAILRAGKLFGKANAWDEAAARFDQLAGLKMVNNYGLESRRLLADAHTRIAAAATNKVVARESARRALLVLDALDDLEESQDPEDRRKRYIVRSRAYSYADKPVLAMRSLDLAEQHSQHGEQDPELAELRALAFERAGRYADAVRAWLYHAQLVTSVTRQDSYIQAAIAANKGGHYAATFAIAKTAENEGFGEALASYSDAALIALDMEPKRLDLFGDIDRIERGERLQRRGFNAEATEALRPVFTRSAVLEDDVRLQLATALAKALAAEKDIDGAILVLRTTVESLSRIKQRESVYQLAATLLERAGEIDRAILALEGRL